MKQKKLSESQEELVLKNENIIYDVLKKMNLYKKKEDYYDVGMIGLIKGVKTYDETKGFAPSTYLYRCVRNEIFLQIRKENSVKNKSNKNTLSYDCVYNNDDKDELEFSNFIEDETQRIEKMLIEKEQYEVLYKEIESLNEKDKFLIKTYYGIDCKRIKQYELAKILNIKQGSISRKIKRILRKLREKMNDFE